MRFLRFDSGAIAWYRSLEWTKEGICKKIPDFQSYLKQQCTTLEAIEKAYQASNEAAQAARSKEQQPCLIGSIHPPRLLKQGYKVITSPQGFPPMVPSEEVQQALLWSCTASHRWALGIFMFIQNGACSNHLKLTAAAHVMTAQVC